MSLANWGGHVTECRPSRRYMPGNELVLGLGLPSPQSRPDRHCEAQPQQLATKFQVSGQAAAQDRATSSSSITLRTVRRRVELIAHLGTAWRMDLASRSSQSGTAPPRLACSAPSRSRLMKVTSRRIRVFENGLHRHRAAGLRSPPQHERSTVTWTATWSRQRSQRESPSSGPSQPPHENGSRSPREVRPMLPNLRPPRSKTQSTRTPTPGCLNRKFEHRLSRRRSNPLF
jgi:hypothetical protein